MHLRPGLGLTSKVFGSAALGAVMGISGTLAVITVPALLSLSSASAAAAPFSHILHATTYIRALSGISSIGFLSAYFLAPAGYAHPYLLWATLFSTSSGIYDLILRPTVKRTATTGAEAKSRDQSGKRKMKMEASYEILGDNTSEGGLSDEVLDEDINGEELKALMAGFALQETIRHGVSTIGFVLSLVGLWGDGPW